MTDALLKQKQQRYFEAIEWASFKFPQISKRELEVIRLLARGFSHEEIGGELHISIETVNTHLRNIRTELGFHRDTQIVVWYLYRKHGIIDFVIILFWILEYIKSLLCI